MGKRALVMGGSGLVGSQLLRQLAADPEYEHITALVRKPLETELPKTEQVVTDWSKLHEMKEWFAVDAVYCCLGTTIKTAGSKEAFRQVDLVYPLIAAELAMGAGARQYAVISSTGADAGSRLFYTRTKGELEQALQKLGFPSLHIVRPSLLMGERREHRTGEKAATVISRMLPFIWSGPLSKYKPVEASVVAGAMREAVHREQPGIHIYESAQLPLLAAASSLPIR